MRHGETPTTGSVLPGRAPGLHLSERGRAQAQRIAERLAGLKVDGVYSSPLERTVETAAPAAAGTGLKVNHEPGLIECDFGVCSAAQGCVDIEHTHTILQNIYVNVEDFRVLAQSVVNRNERYIGVDYKDDIRFSEPFVLVISNRDSD